LLLENISASWPQLRKFSGVRISLVQNSISFFILKTLISKHLEDDYYDDYGNEKNLYANNFIFTKKVRKQYLIVTDLNSNSIPSCYSQFLSNSLKA
jgi:hypothetical protein